MKDILFSECPFRQEIPERFSRGFLKKLNGITMKTEYDSIPPYPTKDGSEIRELIHPDRHGKGRMSFAEATLAPGAKTLAHRHLLTEEIYHFTEGTGVMRLGDKRFPVKPGDTVRIQPGTVHSLENTGASPMKLLCCCSPAYSHDDTEIE